MFSYNTSKDRRNHIKFSNLRQLDTDKFTIQQHLKLKEQLKQTNLAKIEMLKEKLTDILSALQIQILDTLPENIPVVSLHCHQHSNWSNNSKDSHRIHINLPFNRAVPNALSYPQIADLTQAKPLMNELGEIAKCHIVGIVTRSGKRLDVKAECLNELAHKFIHVQYWLNVLNAPRPEDPIKKLQLGKQLFQVYPYSPFKEILTVLNLNRVPKQQQTKVPKNKFWSKNNREKAKTGQGSIGAIWYSA